VGENAVVPHAFASGLVQPDENQNEDADDEHPGEDAAGDEQPERGRR
jgi:hypothetical protein